MPSTYAHYRMGQAVRSNLKKYEDSGANECARIIDTYKDLFLIGVHGPDILFYRMPMFSNKTRNTGYKLHDMPGRYFFDNARAVIKNVSNREPYLAYTYGVLCHFSLDVHCHGYVAAMMKKTGLTHSQIETAFDRMLLEHDNQEPVSKILTGHLKPTAENAKIISAFYPGISPDEIRKAIKGMVFYCNLLVARSRFKRNFLVTGLNVTGNKEISGMIMTAQKDDRCIESSYGLGKRYTNARKKAEYLIKNFDSYLEGFLEDIYQYDFESMLGEKVYGEK